MTWRIASLAAASLLLIAAAGESMVGYALPDEVESFALPDGPGADIVQANCMACHSLDYVTTQPRGLGRDFWQMEVDKMIHRYGAPIAAEDKAPIVDYLSAEFG